MADMPWRFWSRDDLKEGTRYVLAALWRHARSDVREAYLRAGGPPPFVWPTVERLSRLVKRCTSAVEKDLKALREAGLITRDRAVVGGRSLPGWRLLAGPNDDAADVADDETAAPLSGVPPTHVGGTDTDRPVRPAGVPPTHVGDEPHAPPTDPLRPYGATPYARRAVPPTGVGTEARRKPEEKPEAAAEEIRREVPEVVAPTAPAAAAASLDLPPVRAVARRPTATVDGEVPGGTPSSWARELLTELAHMFVPKLPDGRTDETRRIKITPKNLERAERLLRVDLEGLDEDAARAARLERFRYVRGVFERFAELCRRDPAKARWWGPGMLECEPAKGKTRSAWEQVEADVGRADEAAAHAEIQRRNLEAAMRPREAAPEPPPETPEERAAREERIARLEAGTNALRQQIGAPAPARPRARRSEADAERDESREIEIQRKVNAALIEALQLAERAGRRLTDQEADLIRRKVREEQDRADREAR